MTSIVIVCYAKKSFIQETVEAILELTEDFELILVDNHSPFEGTREYLSTIQRATVVDKGYNLGCHQGFNAGFAVAKGDYLVKLDDDTVVTTPKWNTILIDTMKEYEAMTGQKVAYISGNHNCKLSQPESMKKTFKLPTYTFEKWDAIVNFPCILMPYSTYKVFGPFAGSTLYGGEEGYYFKKAQALNMAVGFGMDAKALHKGDVNMDMDYTLWKVRYGFIGDKTQSYEDIRGNIEELKKNARIVLDTPINIPDWKALASKRLTELENA